jgi:hypothetical protein
MTRVLAVVFACVIGSTAFAHDHHRPELDGWFKSLKSKSGVPCCDGSDYNGVEASDWRVKDRKYQVRFKGEWHDVPDEAVIEVPNRAGQAMIWPVEYGGKIHIRCFMPGTLS